MSSAAFRQIKQVLDSLDALSRQEVLRELREAHPVHQLEIDWRVRADVLLEAISLSPDITQRGIRGLLAQAACKEEVIAKLAGWEDVTPPGNYAFDFKLKKAGEDRFVTIQVKMQRKLDGRPMRANEAAGLNDANQYVVETQRTRAGVVRGTTQSTRPYRFGEFDILAVSVEPCTKDWSQFRFTLGRWLIPRPTDANLIAVYQAVSVETNDDWTNDLQTCIQWLDGGVNKTIRGAGTRPRRGRASTSAPFESRPPSGTAS